MTYPHYAEPVSAFYDAELCKAEIMQRYQLQVKNQEPGDRETVAMGIVMFDPYYSYSDDGSVWRTHNRLDHWLRQYDHWYAGSVETARRYLREIGAETDVPRYIPGAYHSERLRALRAGVTDDPWSRIVYPVLVALDELREWLCGIPRTDRDYILPSEVFEGDRTQKTLLVPRRIRGCIDRIVTGVRLAHEEDETLTYLWSELNTTEADRVVIDWRYSIHV